MLEPERTRSLSLSGRYAGVEQIYGLGELTDYEAVRAAGSRTGTHTKSSVLLD